MYIMVDAVSTAQTTDRKLPNYWLRFVFLILAAVVCTLGSFAVGRYSLDIADVVLVFLSSFCGAIKDLHLLSAYSAFLLLPPPLSLLTAMTLDLSAFFADVLDLFFSVLPSPDAMAGNVVFDIRAPRIFAAIFVGAALSTAGAAYQGMFQNPLVSPEILGVSAGAGFGAALAIYFDLGVGAITTLAFAGGLIAVGVAYLISCLAKGSATLSMVLAGILIGSLFSAATSYIKLVADTNDQLPAITYWLMGSLARAEWGYELLFAVTVITIGLIPLCLFRWRMNVLTLGEDEARSIGVNTNLLRLIVIVCATLVTAVAVSISGLIGWVGLVIPHFCRMIFGYDYRGIIPAAVVMGAGFLLLVDDFSRTIAITEVPLGILTAFVGAPIFAYLLMMGERRS
ncbi:MAG: iron ABC transporter permease [Methanocalculaceae archaeon]|jgi:iron complex transport system permease protein|nr:iron ABC transporter permease [Methanocalculaceae archaeon]